MHKIQLHTVVRLVWLPPNHFNYRSWPDPLPCWIYAIILHSFSYMLPGVLPSQLGCLSTELASLEVAEHTKLVWDVYRVSGLTPHTRYTDQVCESAEVDDLTKMIQQTCPIQVGQVWAGPMTH